MNTNQIKILNNLLKTPKGCDHLGTQLLRGVKQEYNQPLLTTTLLPTLTSGDNKDGSQDTVPKVGRTHFAINKDVAWDLHDTLHIEQVYDFEWEQYPLVAATIAKDIMNKEIELFLKVVNQYVQEVETVLEAYTLLKANDLPICTVLSKESVTSVYPNITQSVVNENSIYVLSEPQHVADLTIHKALDITLSATDKLHVEVSEQIQLTNYNNKAVVKVVV